MQQSNLGRFFESAKSTLLRFHRNVELFFEERKKEADLLRIVGVLFIESLLIFLLAGPFFQSSPFLIGGLPLTIIVLLIFGKLFGAKFDALKVIYLTRLASILPLFGLLALLYLSSVFNSHNILLQQLLVLLFLVSSLYFYLVSLKLGFNLSSYVNALFFGFLAYLLEVLMLFLFISALSAFSTATEEEIKVITNIGGTLSAVYTTESINCTVKLPVKWEVSVSETPYRSIVYSPGEEPIVSKSNIPLYYLFSASNTGAGPQAEFKISASPELNFTMEDILKYKEFKEKITNNTADIILRNLSNNAVLLDVFDAKNSHELVILFDSGILLSASYIDRRSVVIEEDLAYILDNMNCYSSVGK